MTIVRNLESLKVKAPQLLFLSMLVTVGTVILLDTLEDTLIDGSSFNYAFAVIGVLLLVAAIIVYKFESAYAELYTLS